MSGENFPWELIGQLDDYSPLARSPDGLRIANIAKSQGDFAMLVVMSNDGSGRRILVRDATLQMGLYRWSPRAVKVQ